MFATFFDSTASIVQSIFKESGTCLNKLISQMMVVITPSQQMTAVNGNLVTIVFAQDNVTSGKLAYVYLNVFLSMKIMNIFQGYTELEYQ